MSVRRYKAVVQPDRKLDVPDLEIAPGTRVEVVILDDEDDYEDKPGELAALLSAEALAQVWDGPEKDEAWAYLQNVM